MQTRGRFVEDIERPSRRSFRQFLGQLHTLRFTTRKGRRLLADLDVGQAHTHECIHFFTNRWDRAEELLGLFHRHIQHIGN